MTCRRCGECAALLHHWLENGDFGSDDPDAEERTDVTHVCKHCAAVGNECSACDGTGSEFAWDDEEGKEVDLECPACEGWGVIEVTEPPA